MLFRSIEPVESPFVMPLAYRYLKSGPEAEDAVQHTFMRLWEQRETFDFSEGLRSLLFTILKNYILNELRHQRIVLEKHEELLQQNSEEEDVIPCITLLY